jgi:L-threonylcarbamoyladenylate synthase
MGQVCSAAELSVRLAAGEPALFPTDTLPALAASPAAADSLWRLKSRPADKPLILMGADLEQLLAWLAAAWDGPWLDQARHCWPGATTLVLPISGPTTEALHPGGASLGLRVPACTAARELLRCTGPLATTSANRSGEPAARDAAEAAALFPDLPLLGPLPWPRGSGQASTVLAWMANPSADGAPSWRVLRGGATAGGAEDVWISGPGGGSASEQAP